MLKRLSFLALLLASCRNGPAPQPVAERYRDAAERIIRAVMERNSACAKLEELCDDVGNRLSGSASLDRAVEWAVATLQRDGQENVRAEKVMVPKWVRGRESCAMTEPREHPMPMLGLGGSVGTPPEGVTAEVAVVKDEAGLEALGAGAKGKIVLFNNPMPAYDPEKGAGYNETVRFRGNGARLASQHGAVAVLVRSVTARSLRSPHTGGTRYRDAAVKIPAAAITCEDADLIERLTKRGKRVVVRLTMEARDEGEAPSANVVAELRGSANPEEVVVIGGHLDTWDVGQGAQDDGGGCVAAMEALNVLRKLGLRPRRTIRVVLWTNEENGLAGARAYAAEHASETHVAAIESDSGSFQPLGFILDHKEPGRLERMASRMRDILGLLEPIGATQVRTGGSGADVDQLKPAGVPVMEIIVEGSKYFDYHHTHADTLDKVDPRELSQCVASMAVVAYVLADMPGRLDD